MALIDLSWMAEFFFFYLTATCDNEKTFYLLKKAFVVNNGCNTIYCTISNVLAVGFQCQKSVLRIRMAVKCVHISGRDWC